MSLKTLKHSFWLVTLAAVIGVGVTAKLGFWQLSRAYEKLALQTAMQEQMAKPPLNQNAILASKDLNASLHRSVQLNGRWLPQHTIFLDNRQMNGKPGFFVLTPFEFKDPITSRKKIILVQRGWVARNFIDRQKIPQTLTHDGLVTLYGRIALPPSKLYEFKGQETGQIRQNIDLKELSLEFNIELLNASVLQFDNPSADTHSQKSNDELVRHWSQPNASADKNYGYMLQWWALSALIAALYVWYQLIRPRLRSKEERQNTV